MILSGKDKGKTGKIEKVFPKQMKIQVEKINIAKKHVKPTKDSEGGIKEILLPFSWSKARVVESTNKKKAIKSAVSKKPKTTKTAKK